MTSTAPITSNQQEPAFDGRAFRRCLSMFATGVTVITAQAGELKAGVTANSFSSLSLDPPLVLWSINRSSRSFPVFRDATHFAINVLAANQIEQSQHFSSSEEDKFAHIGWRPGIGGSPLIDGVIASFECSIENQYDGGDHVLIIGRVEGFSQFEGSPLLFSQGRYGVAEDHPVLKLQRQPAAMGAGVVPPDSPLMTLLFYAYHATYGSFDSYRIIEGLTIPQIRVLSGLYDTPRVNLEQLAKQMFLGPRDAEDAVAELVDMGNVAYVGEGMLELTPVGRARREAFRSRLSEFEASYLADIPDEELAIGRRFLSRLIAKAAPNV